jgi:hypothetical protein
MSSQKATRDAVTPYLYVSSCTESGKHQRMRVFCGQFGKIELLERPPW